MNGRGSDTLSVGDRAPDFALVSTEGAEIVRSRYQDSRPLLLYFFRGTW